MIYETNRCALCEHFEECEYADQINFCEDCKDYNNCGIHIEYCLAMHEIECNNGFELKSEIDWENEDDEER